MTYIALTIGPIYKTLKNAKKPKELFVSSFVFSYIMREIIKEFKERKFITPYIGDKNVFKESDIGVFHDRLIFESHKGDVEKLKDVIEAVLSSLAQGLEIEVEAITSYLQINYNEYTLEENANPIIELMPYLDTLELFYETTQDNRFANRLRRKKGDKDNFLIEGKNIIDDLKKLSYNNYFCVVHADGDRMSKVIESNGGKTEEVSENLFEYCRQSNKLVKAFGGQTIFAGGDDLLFFAPVVSDKNNQTIFKLCEEISKDFETRFKSEATLSFGISINYIKHPLYEALESSRALLFSKAKNEQRNNIAFQVTKHSGQSFDTVVHKGDKESYQQFLSLVANLVNEANDTKFLHSIHHKIATYEKILSLLLKEDNHNKLQNFFDNYFNEEIHQEQYQEFFQALISFMYVSKDLKLLYATLRFMKFVKGDKQ